MQILCWTLFIISVVFHMDSVLETETISMSGMVETNPVSEMLYEIYLSVDSVKHNIHVLKMTCFQKS
jgi:hypothetical protein